MRPKAIKCVCGRGLGSFIKSNRHKKGEPMDNKDSVYSILCSAVKKAICEDYQYIEFYDTFRCAVIGTIDEGYVFADYLWHADEIEEEIEMVHNPNEWNKILKRAFKNRGLEFESLLKEQQKLNSLIAKGLQEAKESKDIVVNVTMGDIIKEALTKLKKKPDDMN